ncbi:MAG: 50S ribosomal protein L11 methyltransferase [Bacteriovoracaceae bacterium]
MNKDKTETYYFEVQVNYPLQYGDLIDDMGHMAMSEFGCGGIEEFSLDEPKVDQILGERSYSGGDLPLEVLEEVEALTLKEKDQQYNYFFYGNGAEEESKEFFQFINLNFPLAQSARYQKAEQDWNMEWKKHYEPILINQKLEIVPAFFQDYKSQANCALYIEPGQGFGTGGHETTYLCLKLFCSLSEKESLATLDFGSGSGILGLAVLKMNLCQSLDLYDIDLEAMKNARVNLEINHLPEQKTRFLLPPEREKLQANYQLVFANILLPVLLLERDQLINYTEKDGHLILSGILNEQGKELQESYLSTGKVRLLEVVSKNDWSAQLYQRL